jgi:hypothetical protein
MRPSRWIEEVKMIADGRINTQKMTPFFEYLYTVINVLYKAVSPKKTIKLKKSVLMYRFFPLKMFMIESIFIIILLLKSFQKESEFSKNLEKPLELYGVNRLVKYSLGWLNSKSNSSIPYL